MALLTNKSILLAEVESTYGTDPTPTTSANAVQVFEVEITPEIDMLERRDFGVTLSRLKELGGKRRVTVSFTTEIRGSGTAGTAPEIDPLLEACGLLGVNTPSTSEVYAPVDDSWKSCTIWVYKDGLVHKVNGCVGNYEIDLVAGETGKIKWEFMGLYNTPEDLSFPTAQTVSSTVPPVCKGLTATFDSYAACVENINIKSNNTITERPCLTATHGIAGFQITDRNPEGSFTPEATLLATKNFWTKFEANTNQALSVAVGSTAGNILTITASQCISRSIAYADRDGIVAHEIGFQLARSTAKDEISLSYT